MATYARKPEDVLKATAGSTGDSLEGSGVPEPKRSLQECDRIMTAPGAVYEWEKKTIFGRDLRVFKNLPPSLRDFWLLASQAWADREYLVLGDERLTFKEVGRIATLVHFSHAQGMSILRWSLPSDCSSGQLCPRTDTRTDAQASCCRRSYARKGVRHQEGRQGRHHYA